ncbi:uncharacterized protein LOC110857040 [Folsomia candida]|uniref:uncharacterized protein LOC110857040 n=1 Tax=Folsomia candida TaxID=158441 RepID=UPI000B8F2E4A|nr:uncharacterized protein LOC110857040 [Folsomia candida]
MSHQSLKFFLVAIFAVGWTYGAAVPAVVVGEKREMPQGGPGGYSGYGSGYESSGGGYGGGSAPAQQQAPGYAMQPPMQQYGGTPPYTNPGFSVQTGIEGYLVPNSQFGILPWGMEGVVVVIAAVIVFIVISVAIVGLLAWLTGFGEYAIVKESARNLLPSRIDFETITDVTNTVLDALDKYDDLQMQKLTK